jgi:putative zinc finger protein
MSEPVHPLALGELLEYWLGEAAPERAERVEEHVFECDACAAALDGVAKLGSALVGLVRGGLVTASATTGLVNRFSRDRLNVRQYSVHPGDVVQCTVSPHDDLLLARLILPAEVPEHVSLSMRDEGGQELARFADVSVDRRSGEVMTFLPARPRQGDPSARLQYVLLAPGDRALATYTLEHTAMSEA